MPLDTAGDLIKRLAEACREVLLLDQARQQVGPAYGMFGREQAAV